MAAIDNQKLCSSREYREFTMAYVFCAGIAKYAGTAPDDTTQVCADGMLRVVEWWCATGPSCRGQKKKAAKVAAREAAKAIGFGDMTVNKALARIARKIHDLPC